MQDGVERLRALWDDETLAPSRRACSAAVVAAAGFAALVARGGDAASRVLAGLLLATAPLPLLWRALRRARRRRSARAVLETTLLRVDPALGAAALRAARLSEQTEARPELGSAELARLHLSRLVARAEPARVAARARALGVGLGALATVLAAAAFVTVAMDPFRLVEGYDVLCARAGRGPLPLRWIEDARVVAEPAAYLRAARTVLEPYFPAALPQGTLLTVHATPRRAGRDLVLTDGKREVPFLSDGEGALVARWQLVGDARLVVAARFGDVLVEEPAALELDVVPDHPPRIRLDGAPATRRLLDEPRIAVHYVATDDHGLTEIVLVLRSGEREERRRLARLDGTPLVDRGGVDLGAEDRFLRRSHVPVEVTIEARDNNPAPSASWGRSHPLVIVPAAIGEREAWRYRALAALRAELVDLLAERLGAQEPLDLAREKAAHAALARSLDALLDESFGGLRIPGRVRALGAGLLERLERTLEQIRVLPAPRARERLVERTESTLLALDSALGAVGHADAQRSALRLSDVATEAAAAVELSRAHEERARAERRLAAALEALASGSGHLAVLGSLGHDLGEIVQNGLRRIERAWSAGDRHHAKLAAEDLAARLRMPVPSFGSAGGDGMGGGVETGAGLGAGESDAEPSEAAEQAAGLEQALEQLRQEHAAEMAGVEQALAEAVGAADREAMGAEMRELARAVRDAVAELPAQASRTGSAHAAAAQGRAQAEAMAGALERGAVDAAVERGEEALGSLRSAGELGAAPDADFADREAGALAGKARERLARELERAKRTLETLRRTASERARERLEQAAEHERAMAERARALAERGADAEAPLPDRIARHLDDAASRMERAARSLGRADGAEGLAHQREAQRLLEMAQPEAEPACERCGERPGAGRSFAQDAEVPGERTDESAAEFRRRVAEGLAGGMPPHLRDAVRRYAEGLVR
jgi:hypothetical protein